MQGLVAGAPISWDVVRAGPESLSYLRGLCGGRR
jgi:hypothetical protein